MSVLRSVIFLLLVSLPTALLYGKGAPPEACESMTPQHANYDHSTAPIPFSIDVDKSEVEHGDKVEVQLKANDPNNNYFKGFFIQARSPGSTRALGAFFIESEYTDSSSYLTCGKGFNNAVTHASEDHKTQVVLKWQPPSDHIGQVNFVTTFVQGFKKFWVKQESIPVTIVKRQTSVNDTSYPEPEPEPTAESQPEPEPNTEHPEPEPNTEHPEEGKPSTSEAFTESIYSGCFTKKGCFGFPEECISKEDCTTIATYAENSGKFDFEIEGHGNSEDYVAVGLSTDEKMGDDGVMECVVEDGVVKIYLSWNNNDKSNTRLPLDRAQEGISNMKGQFVDGQIRCKFTREPTFEFNNRKFDLLNDRYHLLVAAGPRKQDKIGYHSTGKVASVKSTVLSSYIFLEGKSTLFVTLHGSFMIGAWICAASCGIFLARYYKKTWVGSQLCKKDQWFAWHRFFMLIAWGLTIAAVVLIAYHLKGWTALDYQKYPHAILGVVTTVLAFVQPFMAACRPHPTGKNRPIFNWMHWFVGNSAHIIGIVTIFFAVELPSIFLPRWMDWILAGFVGFHILMHLIMLIHTRWSDSKANKSFNTFPMKDMGGHHPPLYPVEKNEDAPGSSCRKFMLAFYFIVNWLVTAALILIVVFDPIEEQLREWGIPV